LRMILELIFDWVALFVMPGGILRPCFLISV